MVAKGRTRDRVDERRERVRMTTVARRKIPSVDRKILGGGTTKGQVRKPVAIMNQTAREGERIQSGKCSFETMGKKGR
jgi:hypothetical protein